MATHLVYADAQGRIFDHPYLEMVGRRGREFCRIPTAELVPLPPGSDLFVLPGRRPVGYDRRRRRLVRAGETKDLPAEAQAVAAFMAPAHTMTYLAAYTTQPRAPILPLFAYTAVGWRAGRFWVAGWRSDPDVRQDIPLVDCAQVERGVQERLAAEPENRLLRHLSQCALTYGCPAARNLFLGRWEAPLPTSPLCNARCLGCLSHQAQRHFPAPMQRITFVPEPAEIAGVAVPHLQQVQQAVASFGQGCEGEPLLQGPTLLAAVQLIRRQVSRGTLNLNTNASRPEMVKALVDAGLDSLRVSLNSARPEYYAAYYRPQGYQWPEVVAAIRAAKASGAKVALNYLIFPGFSDQPAEVAALSQLIAQTEVDLIQLRNLNIDPDYYLRGIRWHDQERPLGIRRLVDRLQETFPSLRFGYFNPAWRG
uniref:radical SAM protein n=1 Tax=Desulfobacca sp. TaxID=2067990 RepID=UPI004049EB1A